MQEGWAKDTTECQHTEKKDAQGEVNRHIWGKNAKHSESDYAHHDQREKKANANDLQQGPHVGSHGCLFPALSMHAVTVADSFSGGSQNRVGSLAPRGSPNRR
jgi:hypothetical protein